MTEHASLAPDVEVARRPTVVVYVAATSRDAVDDLHRLAAESILGLLETGGRVPPAA